MPEWCILLLVMAAIFLLTHYIRKSPMSDAPS
jgi:hypothetical protein